MDNVLFFRIPKTASTSITKVLKYQYDFYKFETSNTKKNHSIIYSETSKGGHFILGHQHIPTLVNQNILNRDFLQTAYTFAFVRNPYTRLVSLYHYLKGKIHNESTFEKFVFRYIDNGKKIHPLGSYSLNGFNQCNPQTKWMFKNVSFIGKYENLETDLKKVLQELGFSINNLEIPTERKSNITDYFSYYTSSRVIQIVNKVYESDFERFDYKLME